MCCLIQVIFLMQGQYVFGSNVDWMKQHIVFPDYFRNLFYQTGDLFPEFSLHLGSGQNIFYFAYYGLYSPITFLSYLFPFLPMGVYLIIISVLSMILTVFLFYYFLRKNQIPNQICFFTCLLFLFSSSFFQFHRHLMFVNYMPFLVLALFGVIQYFEKKKSILLVISIFLLILTSYYYSIPGLIAICLYGLYFTLKNQKSFSWKELFSSILKFSIRILLGILLAAILLFPLIYVILNGRLSSASNLTFSMFFPDFSLDYLMYGTYGIGLTAIAWIGFIYSIFFTKKELRIPTILLGVILTFPIFNYLLNGRLYLNGKVFIPFLPLFLFFIAKTVKSMKEEKKSWKWIIFIVYACAIIFLGIEKTERYLYFYLELTISFILLYFYQKKKKEYYLIPIVLSACIIAISNHLVDDFVTRSDFQKQQSYYRYDVFNYINQNTESIYRYQDDLSLANGINFSYGKRDYRTTLYSSTSNYNYWSNYYDTFLNNDIYRNHFMLAQTNNLFFQRFLGIRYLLTNREVPFGYHKIKEYKDGSLYENQDVYPIGFSSTHLLNQKTYDQLPLFEKLEAYQNNIIISNTSNNENLKFVGQKISLDTTLLSSNNLNYKKTDTGYQITSKENGKIVLELQQPIFNHTLLIHFLMHDIPSCKNGDTAITINGITNKLTCKTWRYYNHNETFDYVLSSRDEINQLEIGFSKGTYDIREIEIYELPNSFFESSSDITPLSIDFNQTKENQIVGTLNQKEDGYFIFTIPYDQGFTALVDGKKVKLENVNELFIGFPLTSGSHQIQLSFEAPYAKIGKIATIFSFCWLVCLVLIEKKETI